MATLTQRFPYRVAMGFEGGSGFSTSIGVVLSGKEKRNVNLSNPLGRWTATQLHKTEAPTKELLKYFHAAQGRANNFPFRDWTDYKVVAGEGVLELLSSGGLPAIYQLQKQYVLGGQTRRRDIILPVSAVVAGGGAYSVDTATGQVIHGSGPAPTSWTGEFNVLARFNTDELNLTIVDKRGDGQFIYTWGNIEIKEDRP